MAPALDRLASAKAQGAQHAGAHITAALASQTSVAFLAAAPPFAAYPTFTGARPGFFFGTGAPAPQGGPFHPRIHGISCLNLSGGHSGVELG